MARFLIEVPHEPELVACARAVEVLLKTGSHFLTHADWGCADGEHKAWIILEVADENEARFVVPPSMRREAKIVKLNYFASEEIDAIPRRHELPAQQPNQWHARGEGGTELYEASQ